MTYAYFKDGKVIGFQDPLPLEDTSPDALTDLPVDSPERTPA